LDVVEVAAPSTVDAGPAYATWATARFFAAGAIGRAVTTGAGADARRGAAADGAGIDNAAADEGSADKTADDDPVDAAADGATAADAAVAGAAAASGAEPGGADPLGAAGTFDGSERHEHISTASTATASRRVA